MYIQILNKNKLFIKFLFVTIWFSLIFRITNYIDLQNHILQFDSTKWIFFITDLSSIVIAISLLIYLLIHFKIYKKISITALLIIYPIFGLTGYVLMDIKNQLQDNIVWHHFITLSSAFLFFAIIESKKLFDLKFKVLLLKIFLTIIFLYFLIYYLPTLVIGIYLKQDLRVTQKIIFTIFNNQFYIEQNVNGATRIFVILLIASLVFFKKFIFKKKKIAHVFFLICPFLMAFIYILQSRLNILLAVCFSLFLLFSIKNLDLKKKIIYFSIIVIFPLIISNIYFKQKSRFLNPMTHINYNQNFLDTEKKISKIYSFYKINSILGITLKNAENIKDLSYKDYILLNNLINEGNKIPYYNHSQTLYFAKIILVLHSNALLAQCSPNSDYFDRLLTGRICGWEILLKNIRTADLIFGKGFFSDQLYLKWTEKTSSNSWLNIFFNAGIFALVVYFIFIIFFLRFFFKTKNFNHKNSYIPISHYLFIYFLIRSFLEDTLAFVSIDFLLLFISISIIKETKANYSF